MGCCNRLWSGRSWTVKGRPASDRYEVVAGGRRLAALKLLAKQKRITKGTASPCRVLDADVVDGTEASLAENIVR